MIENVDFYDEMKKRIQNNIEKILEIQKKNPNHKVNVGHQKISIKQFLKEFWICYNQSTTWFQIQAILIILMLTCLWFTKSTLNIILLCCISYTIGYIATSSNKIVKNN